MKILESRFYAVYFDENGTGRLTPVNVTVRSGESIREAATRMCVETKANDILLRQIPVEEDPNVHGHLSSVMKNRIDAAKLEEELETKREEIVNSIDDMDSTDSTLVLVEEYAELKVNNARGGLQSALDLTEVRSEDKGL